MFLFLIPLALGFGFNIASAFTTFFSRRWGARRGSIVSVILRDVLGIPVWALGFVLAGRTPSPSLFVKTAGTDIAGWSLVGMGALIILIALVTIRARAAAPSTGDALAARGIYAHVRHPIHDGTFLEFAGLLFLAPHQAMAIACVMGTAWILVQTRFEEHDLLQRLPGYRGYMERVPRFWPRLRKE